MRNAAMRLMVIGMLAALALMLCGAAQATVLVYDEFNNTGGGGTVGWAAGSSFGFTQQYSELISTGGWPRRMFSRAIGGVAGEETLWYAVTMRMSDASTDYACVTTMGQNSWTAGDQHNSIGFVKDTPTSGVFSMGGTNVLSGIDPTDRQTFLVRYDFTPSGTGRYNITSSVWAGAAFGATIDYNSAPLGIGHAYDTTFNSFYITQGDSKNKLYVDRMKVATTPAEALAFSETQPPPAPPPPPPTLTNPGFENGITAWGENWGGTIVSNIVHTGSKANRITKVSGQTDPDAVWSGFYQDYTGKFRGKKVIASVWAYVPASDPLTGDANVYLGIESDNGTVYSTPSMLGAGCQTGSWQKFTLDYTPTAQTTFLRFKVSYEANYDLWGQQMTHGGGTVYFDDAAMNILTYVDISGDSNIDTKVGTGNIGRLTGATNTNWNSVTFTVAVDLNGNTLDINSGAGNPMNAAGTILGAGAVTTHGGPWWSVNWNNPVIISGTDSNRYVGPTTIAGGTTKMSKTAGFDALLGEIAVGSNADSARLTWGASNQINDRANVTVLNSVKHDSIYPDANLNFLDLAGYSDTFNALTLDSSTQVRTGTGGVLTVYGLTFGDQTYGVGTYTAASAPFITGTGSVVIAAPATPATWNINSAGSWASPGSWTIGIPAGAVSTARFLGAITAPTTVTLTANTTIGTVEFNNANKYTIAGAKTLTFGGAATVNTIAGTHEIAAPITGTAGLVKIGAGILVLSGANTLTGPVTVSAGELQVGKLNEAANAQVTVAAGAGLLADRIRGNKLTVNGTTTLRASGLDANVSIFDSTNTLTIGAAGKLDLKNNDLIVKGGNLTTIKGQIATAYAGGTWAGNGITTMTGTAGAGLGVDTADHLGLISFAVQTVAAGDVLVKYTWLGDADFSGVVDFSDFLKLQAGYGKAGQTWTNGDFDYNGSVDFSDFLLLQAAYGKAALSDAVTPVSIPEPAAMSLLALGGLALLRRRSPKV